MHIPVIFEDSDIVVIDKPSGVVVHPYDFSTEETILDFLHANYSEICRQKLDAHINCARTCLLSAIRLLETRPTEAP
jgi:23S rRNA-/tRNA-specific pseudouridylate synthase